MSSSKLSPNVSGVQTADVLYLKREAHHQHEKPFKLRYDPGEGIPRSNCTNESCNIKIHDLRGNESSASLKSNGFAWLPLRSSLASEEFYDDEKKYWNIGQAPTPNRTTKLKRSSTQTRKTHEQFPIALGEPFEHLQPTTIVHIGETDMVISPFAVQVLTGHRFYTFSVWKPLRGPVNDWPLALCDPRTVNQSEDLVAVDVVTREGCTENVQVYHSSRHSWYYLSDQFDTVATLFSQVDTAQRGKAGVPHTGFQHSNAAVASHPRESVELRAFLYYH
ncbi:hypothetical protein BCR34DRAFT_640632 [Clohesyomyces aquaticus]|uniref:Uncharacterized protein n=1 Tax=Clohesyomyces aquaticus TaxID=1231657 RepID=A0A1Y1YKY8_9PLEO|nr:hypothetical protein BCR34DRAFT_640632 [Clohesyomyces aquaticus]